MVPHQSYFDLRAKLTPAPSHLAGFRSGEDLRRLVEQFLEQGWLLEVSDRAIQWQEELFKSWKESGAVPLKALRHSYLGNVYTADGRDKGTLGKPCMVMDDFLIEVVPTPNYLPSSSAKTGNDKNFQRGESYCWWRVAPYLLPEMVQLTLF